jgi:hypothetical protein
VNAAALGTAPGAKAADSRWDLYKGWLLGILIVVIVLAIGAGFWLHFHP